MADPTNTIKIVSSTGTEEYTELRAALTSMTAGNDYEMTVDGVVAAETSSQIDIKAANLVIKGNGELSTKGSIFVGSSSSQATNMTIAEGSDIKVVAEDPGLNFRHYNKVASTLTINNARLWIDKGPMPTNGKVTINGYGTTAQTDSAGNTLYGFKDAEGNFVANLQVWNAYTVKDRFEEYEDNIACVLKDYAWLKAGTMNLSTDDAGNKSVAIVENSKITLGDDNNHSGNLAFSVANAEMRLSGNSEFRGALKFNKVGNFSVKDDSTVVLKHISGAESAKIKYTKPSDGTEGETTFTLVGSGTIDVDGLQASVAIDKIGNNGDITFTLTSDDFSSIAEVGATHTMLEFVNSHLYETCTVVGKTVEIENALIPVVSVETKDHKEFSALEYVKVTIDGNAYTIGDEIVDAAGNKYVIDWQALGDDGVANDLVATLTEKAPEPVIPEDPVLPEDPGVDGGASTEPSQKVYINPYYNEYTLGYFSDVVGEELVLGKNAFTSVAAAKKALGANADIEYCTSDWNSSFSNSKQLEGIAKISNNGYSMGYTYANYVQQYNMSNGMLNLNKVTADTDFENFAYVNISGSKLSGAIENNAFGFFGTGNAEKASGTAWFAQGGMVNISGSTVGEVTGYAYATLNGSDVDVLSNNDVLYANVTLENGEITSCKPIYAMANGMAQINNSDVGLLENYSYVNMSGSNIADVRNVNMIGNWGGSSSIDNFVGASMYSSISNGYGCSLTLGDVTMNGSFDSIVNYGGTLVLTGNLKGVEMLYGYGDLVASDEQIKQLGGAEKVKQTYFGDIVDLGSTADGFSGKAAELADNSEAKAVIWDAATEGGLRGWLGIGSDVDVKDSVDYVKFTAASDGTLDITSSAWSSTGDKVSINGTELAITDGAVSFGVTAGTEYLVKIERKDNNSMSYDMTLA